MSDKHLFVPYTKCPKCEGTKFIRAMGQHVCQTCHGQQAAAQQSIAAKKRWAKEKHAKTNRLG